MTYTEIAVVAALVAVAVDWWVLRTRLVVTRGWWIAYAIILFFQLLTNGWLTGRRIVRYDADAIIGTDEVRFVGDGRLFFAPVEDLAFGFALVLLSCCVWVWLGRRGAATDSSSGASGDIESSTAQA